MSSSNIPEILDQSRFHSAGEWRNTLEHVSRNSGLLKDAGLEDSFENRSSLIVSYLRDFFEERMPGMISTGKIPKESLPGLGHSNDLFSSQVEYFMPPGILRELPALLFGKKEYGRVEKDSTSLERHLYRSGVLKRVLVTRIFQSSDNGNTQAKDFKKTFNEKYKYLGIAFLHAFSHDWGRWVTQSSEHDIWSDRIIRATFPDSISRLILEGQHSPVPNNHVLLDQEIGGFDSDIQKLNRISDVFGKLTPKNRIRNVDEIIRYSKERQTNYFKDERNNPKSEWYQKTEDNLKIYLGNEEKVLRADISWLDGMGVSWNELVSTFNESLNFKPEIEYYNHMAGHLSYSDQAKEII